MAINLSVSDELPSVDLDELASYTGLLEEAAMTTLRACSEVETVDLTIAISGDEPLSELNRQFLGVDAPTDVLSFPADEVDPETGIRYLGDVVISLPQAKSQASTGGHSVVDELRLLVVHGVLHLLGYDHAEQGEKEAMWSVQAEILSRLGSQAGPPP